jgi:hypothetical protein
MSVPSTNQVALWIAFAQKGSSLVSNLRPRLVEPVKWFRARGSTIVLLEVAMDLLEMLMGSGTKRAEYAQFANRYEQGRP